jgi:tetraacyldisaccharide 4'-kinase
MWQSLHDAWWRLATHSQPQSFTDVLACSALQACSAVYETGVASRNAAYDRGWVKAVRLPCPVVSVGNLTVGGTGKTSCVELVAKKLLARHHQPAILSRGYGGARRDYWLRWADDRLQVDGCAVSSAEDLADEPQLLARRLDGVPIMVGANRERTGRLACAQLGADALILDDGFQHRRVQRDCDIVLVHARTPLGGWGVFPRGPMREPIEALSRADVIVLTKADEAFELLGALEERVRSLAPEASVITALHAPATLKDASTGTLDDPKRLEGLRLGLLSSIGDPFGFESTVRRLQGNVAWHWAFPDHHAYDFAHWAAIAQRVQETRPHAVVTTEKDWVRLAPLAESRAAWAVPVWVLGVEMKLLSGEDELDDRLARLHAR